MPPKNIECTIDELEQEAQKLVSQNIAKGEKPLLCIKYKGSGYYRVGVITENKVIIIYGGEIFGHVPFYSSACIHMKDISQLEHPGYAHRVEFKTYSNTVEIPIIFFSDTHLEDKFISVFQQVWSAFKQKFDVNSQPCNKPSVSERLDELNRLKSKGTVSDLEYKQLREQILKDL